MNYLHSWQLYFIISYYFMELVEAYIPYRTILLEDPDVCSEITTRGVKFDSTTAINLTQNRLGDHSLKWATSVRCHFRLKPPSKHNGIIVVIQELLLRKNDTTGECIDYVQFKTDRGRTSEKICGELDARYIMNNKPNIFDTQSKDNTFISDRGHLDVYVFISREPLKFEETTRINIIFTLFNYCVSSPERYKPCLDTREICIHENYFYDGVINCPFFDCVDEGSCGEVVINTSIGNKVLIASVTSLVLIFVIFILCLYICRKQGKLCWSEHFASPNSSTQAQTTRVIEMNETPNQPQNTSAPAPALHDQEDKDLPPSYESLFPSR